MKNKLITISLCSVFFIGCLLTACRQAKTENIVDGLAPIYSSLSEINKIEVMAPQGIINAGKIYQYGANYTLQVDVNKGIHIINCSDTKNPVKIKFIAIPGVTELSIKDDILLVNNFADLVSISLVDLNNITVTNRLNDVYSNSQSTIPSEANTYFECADVTKGIIVGWQPKKLTNPQCKTL